MIPREIEAALQVHLHNIARIFRAPRITIIVRAAESPGGGEGNVVGDLVLSNDNPTSALETLRARMVAEAEILAGTDETMRVQIKEASPVRPRLEAAEGRARPSGNNSRSRPANADQSA